MFAIYYNIYYYYNILYLLLEDIMAQNKVVTNQRKHTLLH